MTHTQQEIADAARLVPGTFVGDDGRGYKYGSCNTFCPNSWDNCEQDCQAPDCLEALPWQPTADTEAGKAGWAVLDTAVIKWLDDSGMKAPIPAHVFSEYYDAVISGDLVRRQAATFAAAAAIGRHMRESE